MTAVFHSEIRILGTAIAEERYGQPKLLAQQCHGDSLLEKIQRQYVHHGSPEIPMQNQDGKKHSRSEETRIAQLSHL
jgi:hypothetical protein